MTTRINELHFHDTGSGGALASAPDRTIAGRAADGDIGAFTILVQRFGPMMTAYVRRMLGSSADVDDVVQEAFVTAWQRLETLRDPAQVKSWLMRIASNAAVDRIRARKPVGDLEEIQVAAPDSSDPVRRAEARSELEALDQALKDLPEQQRQCWVLREFGGHSYEEIAEQLGVPTSTVRGQLARARKFLMARLEEWR